jgi:hypothetical protein
MGSRSARISKDGEFDDTLSLNSHMLMRCSGYWNLYVDTLGGECVIASDCGFDLEPFDDEGRRAKNEALLNETERSLRIPTLDISSWDFLLEATSFEGYLVTMLAEDWAYGWLEEDPDEVPIPHPLEDFTLKVFAKENRAQS